MKAHLITAEVKKDNPADMPPDMEKAGPMGMMKKMMAMMGEMMAMLKKPA